MKSELLQRLSKEKPENNSDEIEEALRRGYSMRQIMKVLQTGIFETEPRKGILRYRWVTGERRKELEVPYTYETFMMLFQKIFD